MKKAFTMAEAILVMTILGIIATIMISTLKPAEYKDKALAIMAKKVLSEIDAATTQILVNDTFGGNFGNGVYKPGTSELVPACGGSANISVIAELYKKYLTAIRKPCTNKEQCGMCDPTSYPVSGAIGFYLKDGACVTIGRGSVPWGAVTPGDEYHGEVRAAGCYRIVFDINGAEEPNLPGKDFFTLPVDPPGINYE